MVGLRPERVVEVAVMGFVAGASFCAAWEATARFVGRTRRRPSGSAETSEEEGEDAVDEGESLMGGHAFYEVTPSTYSTRNEVRAIGRVASNHSLVSGGGSGGDGSQSGDSGTDKGLTAFGDADGTFGSRNKLVVAMVGLPARGKSYLVKMLVRYLTWIGFPTRIFNVGELRRRKGLAGASADFFGNTEAAQAQRDRLAMLCQEDMYDWLESNCSSCVAIFDATNTTVARRAKLVARCAAAEGVSLVFVESICDDPVVLKRNYHMKLQNADYKGQDPDAALADFLRRVEEYEARYETVRDDEGDGSCAYVKLINVGEKVITRHCSGYLTSQLAFFLGNVHIAPRRIWLALHGESRAQVESQRIGASAGGLTRRGAAFSRRLAAFVSEAHSAFCADFDLDDDALVVLSGNAPIHAETLRPLLGAARECKGLETAVLTSSLLNELCGGDFDGLSAKEFTERYPGIWRKRMADKLRFRYPGAGGESYLDVIARLRPILIELERQTRSVLLVSHLAVQRCLYSYFTGTDVEAIPYLPLPSGAVIELTPTPHGTTVETHVLLRPDEVVDDDAANDPASPPNLSPHHGKRRDRDRVSTEDLEIASTGSLGALLRASDASEDDAPTREEAPAAVGT